MSKLGYRCRRQRSDLEACDPLGCLQVAEDDAQGMGAIELVADKRSKRSFDPAQGVAARCARFAEEQGLIVRFVINDTLTLSPPLVITPQEIDEVFDRLGRALDRTLDWAKREQLLAA